MKMYVPLALQMPFAQPMNVAWRFNILVVSKHSDHEHLLPALHLVWSSWLIGMTELHAAGKFLANTALKHAQCSSPLE